jgi:hypothetical protein
VSDEPISTDEAKPERLSGPAEEKSSFTVAVAPLPEIGRIMTTGNISAGMPKKFINGIAIEHRASSAPEAVNIFTATTSKRRVGNIERAVLRPSVQPDKKTEKRSSFEIIGSIDERVITNGRISEAKNSAVIFSPFFCI